MNESARGALIPDRNEAKVRSHSPCFDAKPRGGMLSFIWLSSTMLASFTGVLRLDTVEGSIIVARLIAAGYLAFV